MNPPDPEPLPAPPVVVSLTSTSERLAALPPVLERILNQSLRPARVTLWLSREPFLFDRGVDPSDLPSQVREWEREGRLEVRFTPNTGPHRKLLPLLHELSGETNPPLVVTADDDTLYPHRWLAALVGGWQSQGCAVAFRARRMLRGPDGPLPYKQWPVIPAEEEVLGHHLVATGKDGMLVHPDHLDPRILDPRVQQFSRTRSDIWIAGALRARKTPLLKLSTQRLFPDPTGVTPEAKGVLPPPRVDGSDPRQHWSELYIYNKRHSDAYLRRTFAFFDGEATEADLPGESPSGGDAADPGAPPRFTVVIPYYNQPERIVTAVRSALAQTRQPTEVVVVDDASAIPPVLAEHPRLRVLTLKTNQGVSAARNHGIREARGRFVTFLDDDDVLEPFHVEAAYHAWKEWRGAQPRVVLTGMSWHRESGELSRRFFPPTLPMGAVFHLEEIPPRTSFLTKQTLFAEREFLLSLGGFDESFRTRQWTELFFRLGAKAAVVGVGDITYRRMMHSRQRSRTSRDRDEVFRRMVALHEPLLRTNPRGYRRFLVAHADRLLESGERTAAMRVYAKAFLVHPPSVGAARDWIRRRRRRMAARPGLL